MQVPHSSHSETAPRLADLVATACAMEARQRQTAMQADDLRVQETVAELILISGEDLGPAGFLKSQPCLR